MGSYFKRESEYFDLLNESKPAGFNVAPSDDEFMTLLLFLESLKKFNV